MKYVSVLSAAVLGLSLAACASKPAPVEPTPAPVERPAPQPRPEPQGPVAGSVQDFEVNAGDRVFYGYDRYDLTGEARETLRRQASWLNAYPQTRILVAGNCDERGTREYNLALGNRRAQSARDFLISQGVDPSRISVVSYGKERPTCTENSERCHAVNRNAITVITDGAAS